MKKQRLLFLIVIKNGKRTENWYSKKEWKAVDVSKKLPAGRPMVGDPPPFGCYINDGTLGMSNAKIKALRLAIAMK